MYIPVIDTETTGIDPATDRVVEFAAVFISPSEGYGSDELYTGEDGPWHVLGHASFLCDPERDIPATARAVHHISPADVAGKPPLRDAVDGLLPTHPDDGLAGWAAHNMAFDWEFVKGVLPKAPLLCTYRMAKHLYPEAPAFGNQVLRYWLGVEPPYMTTEAGQAHRALYDALVTAGLLCHMLNTKVGLTEAIRLSDPKLPAPQACVPVGQYRGKPWADMDAGFCRWVIDPKREFDVDTLHAAKSQLVRLETIRRDNFSKMRAARGLTS